MPLGTFDGAQFDQITFDYTTVVGATLNMMGIGRLAATAKRILGGSLSISGIGQLSLIGTVIIIIRKVIGLAVKMLNRDLAVKMLPRDLTVKMLNRDLAVKMLPRDLTVKMLNRDLTVKMRVK